MKPEIFFEDDFLFAISKPAGMHSVGDGDSVSNWLAIERPELRAVGEKPEDSGLIHRLDFWTSGVLVGAKSREIWLKLRKLLKAGKIEKEYSILVEGCLKEPITVENFIGSPYRRSEKMRVYKTHKPRTLPAKSVFVPHEYNQEIDATKAQVICNLARRHQIRAHAASIGHPLMGDKLYGAKRELGPTTSNQKRQFLLHAGLVRFEHPISGKELYLKKELYF